MNKFILSLITVSLVAVVSSACGSAEPDPLPTPTSVAERSAAQSSQAAACEAPELVAEGGPRPEVTGIEGWINSSPLLIQELANDNEVVLIDFWTYTCVNCLRTLPFLREWHDKYSDRGLTIIGVHTPEFEFEKRRENIEAAADEEGVVWPIAIDNEFATWRAFGNRFWPAKYLIDSSGKIVYKHFGEGKYCETEQAIRSALESAGEDVSDIETGVINSQTRDSNAVTQTREIYGGTRWSTPFNPYAGNLEYYAQDDDNVIEFVDPGDYAHNFYYLQGLWRRGPESISHARSTENLEDFIVLRTLSRSVNVVVSSEAQEPFDVYVFLDDEPLKENESGDDIMFDEQGRSFFRADSPRLYKIVEQETFAERTLKVTSNSEDFSVFAFTFGTYETGF